jgi:flagellar P-ring protein precursor FlgI
MRHRPWFMFIAAAALLSPAFAAAGTTVKDVARIKGQGRSTVTGIGIVTGLSGTGDSGKDPALARALQRLMENNALTVESLKDLQGVKAVALVMVSAEIPESGGRADDTFDAIVTTIGTAQSLRGGTLFLAPLQEPGGAREVYAVARGTIDIEDTSVPTRGRVRSGAQLVRDITMPTPGDQFDLLLDPAYVGWGAASAIAEAINADAQPLGPKVAVAVDDRTVRIDIPKAERGRKAEFLAAVLSSKVSSAMLEQPAQVICNPRTGVIVMTGDVEISPGAVTHKDLVITTTVPAPIPTPLTPIVERSRWTGLQTNARPSENGKLQDLLAAFKQLDVPPVQQIEVLQMLHKTGRLHAKLIVE